MNESTKRLSDKVSNFASDLSDIMKDDAPLKPSFRSIFVAASGAILFISFVVVLQFYDWQGSRELHTNMEVAATFMAITVGVLAMVRFYSKKNSMYLFLATGFVGTACLDGYHAVVTSNLLNYIMPSPPESLIPWSWNASRTFLAILMTIMWGTSIWEKQQGGMYRINEMHVYATVILLTLVSFLFFAFFPLPRAYYPEFFIGRPEEFVAALFFFIAMVGFASQTTLRKDSFETWLVWSLFVGFVGQTFAMSRSFALFDLPFDLAHTLKIVSYLLVLIGLFIEVHQLFQRLEETRANLSKQAQELRVKAIGQRNALKRNEIVVRNLEIANEQVEQARLTAEDATRCKSEFLANMSHEIRTPMTAILGYADILVDLLSGKIDHEQVSGTVQTIRKNANHLLTIINDILDMSKIESGKMKVERVETSPISIAKEVETLLKHRAVEKGIGLSIKYDTPIPEMIDSDPTRLRQILLNLVGNSVKFTQVGEVVIHLSADISKRQMQFSIVDSGIGMTSEQRDHIAKFDAFSQADTSTTRIFGGSGLGLRISNSLAVLLGGKLEVESEINVGSTFTLTVDMGNVSSTNLISPLSLEQKNRLVETKNTIQSNEVDGKALENRRVLLVEDGPDNQRLITYILKKAGAEVVCEGNGLLGTKRYHSAQNDEQPFDVILMDMQMPVMDGYEAARQLRQEGSTIPIIALTAHAMATDRQLCLDAGCDDFTTKPINRIEMIDIILKHVGKFTIRS